MSQADARHANAAIETKLQRIYALHRKEMDFRLERSPYADLLAALGNPHEKLPPTIHVAGTNGKGSTLAFLRAMLESAGHKVHAYTSPHLLTFNERIVLAGEIISDPDLETLLDEVWQVAHTMELTFFEVTTAMAFLAFSRTKADVLLLETGMGGRLDCTNIIKHPIATAITRISYDHMDFLGNTLPQIAAEKAGIMKASVPCIIAPQKDMDLVAPVFIEHATKVGSPLFLHGRDWHGAGSLTLSLSGAHQQENAATALEIAKHIAPLQTNPEGLQKTTWPARLEKIMAGCVFAALPAGSELWFDAAHNDSGAESLANWLKTKKQHTALPVHLVLGMGADKDANAFLQTLKGCYESLTVVDLPYARKPQTALELRQKLGIAYASTLWAPMVSQAVSGCYGPCVVVVAGSLYLYAQVV